MDPKQIEDFATNALERQKKEKEAKEKRLNLNKKEFEKLKVACEYIFRLSEGKILAKAMMRMSGIYTHNKNNNNLYEIGKERGKEEMYLFFVKGMLPTRIVMDIEKKIEQKEVSDE